MENGVKTLSEELQQKAIDELNEVPERIPEDIKHIKDWLKKQPHINARLGDHWLLIFLRGSKFSLERTKRKLDEFYMSKTLIHEFFSNRDPFLPEIQRVLKLGIYLPLLKTETPTTPVNILIRNGVYDLNVDDAENILKMWFMLVEILMIENYNFVIAGLNSIVDCKGVTLSHYAVSPSVMEKMLSLHQGTLPVRVKRYYFINTSRIFEICFKVMKPFIGNKLLSRVKHFSESEIENFYMEHPRKLMTEEYGGGAGSINDLIDYWKTKVESYADWFKDDSKYCTNETLRPGKPKTVYDVFGVEGSFRQLNVD